MNLQTLRHAPTANLSYLLCAGQQAVVIDPSFQASELLERARALGLQIAYVLNTHGHHDHSAGNEAICTATGATLIDARAQSPIELGALRIQVIPTPGHTPDSVCFLSDGKLFTGDTLFVGECGRTDLPGGDAGQLYDSLFVTLARLPDSTEIYPGHDYGPQPVSTLGRERRDNYVLRRRTREQFIAFMQEP